MTSKSSSKSSPSSQRKEDFWDARILLVDDDPFILTLLSTWLEEAGYDIHTAENGEEAVEQLPEFRPDLVITDLRMDGMDGITLLSEIQKYNAVLPVIMLSGSARINDAVHATHKGIFEFLTKPIEPDALFQCVRSALNHAGTAQDADNIFAPQIIHKSTVMANLLKQAQRVARTRSSVHISGPTGTGKELLARAIHNASPRRNEVFVAINCGALSEQLLESELFGHEKGAFTGAVRRHPGLFQASDGGTLFMDEVGDMPASLQVKLLRVLQEGQVKPVGAVDTVPIDVRLISATNRDLAVEVQRGEFREDLFYRLNVVPLHIPTLAERRDDIPLLIEHFLARQAEEENMKSLRFSPDAMEYMTTMPWPGNVRQLRNVVEQCSVLSASPVIPLLLVKQALQRGSECAKFQTLAEAHQELNRTYLSRVLRMTEGNVEQAADIAGCKQDELHGLLNEYMLDPQAFRRKQDEDNDEHKISKPLDDDGLRLH